MATVDNPTSALLTLPNELLGEVASNLTPSGLYRLQRTNRRLCSIVSADLQAMFVDLKDDILLEAASHNNDSLMQRAIAAGAHVPIEDILDDDEIHNNDKTVRVVLDVWSHTVNQKYEGRRFFFKMIEGRNVNVVRMMLEPGMFRDRGMAEIETCFQHCIMLCYAVRTGCVELVQVMLSHCFDVRRMTPHKRYCMSMHAIRSRNIPMLKVLLDAGILEVVTPYRANGDAVHATARSGSVEMIQLLLQHRASVEAGRKYDRTPLQATVISPGCDEMLQFLGGNGADINSKDDAGSTAFDRAVGRGNL